MSYTEYFYIIAFNEDLYIKLRNIHQYQARDTLLVSVEKA